MKSHSSLENQDYFIVLEKFINFYLFGNSVKPKLISEKAYQFNPEFVKHIEEITADGKSDIKSAISYFENICRKFVVKSTKSDRVNLVLCYMESNIRTAKKIFKLLNPKNNIKDDGEFQEIEMAQKLVHQKEIPEEILMFLKGHFSEILNFIPMSASHLSKEQYEKILQNFLRHTDYEEILNQYAARDTKAS
ncbi:hypothetical protein SAMN05421796_108184 [Chryseobacterium piscicola]|uniref:Uncharacterized protein n=1 Tax=Chryseobacterium piscicola TaxID=551459 RepID=A0A1N7NNJ7_9FLAO|nr:hypothetical protein [Chryseobacterium piscicola]PQA90395.1 hypothetical protein B0A70_13720 [Chryseobacterium piscicola]SIS99871.1 hypothetical protein SAMN05421796_108184 [Chryseobacterium piscicola]